jgi:tetratricopeptide (TPR) repeat protein
MEVNCLKISGKDSLSFLQRQSTNDLKELKTPVYAAFCLANASLVSLTLISKSPEGIIIQCKNPEALKEHLEKFAIIEDINFEIIDSSNIDCHVATSSLLATTDSTSPLTMTDEFTQGESLIKLVEAHPEKNLLDKYVSFTKGCFPGQEPLAKFKNIGLRKREERSQTMLDEALELFAHAKNPQELDPAIELLRKALKENPRNEDAYESLGVMLAKQEKYQEAIQVMHTLEMINPQNQMAQMNLSIFYMKIGDKETAEEHKAKGTVLQFEEALKK